MTPPLVVKVITFLILVPGSVVILVPYLLLTSGGFFPSLGDSAWPYLGVVPILLGTYVLLRSVWDFLVVGKGTPVPIDPPKDLVVTGFYRYVRNPMYVAVLLVLAGESLFFKSLSVLLYTAAFAICVHLFVVFYEEPVLQDKFGESYMRYRHSVRRWIPHLRPVSKLT